MFSKKIQSVRMWDTNRVYFGLNEGMFCISPAKDVKVLKNGNPVSVTVGGLQRLLQQGKTISLHNYGGGNTVVLH